MELPQSPAVVRAHRQQGRTDRCSQLRGLVFQHHVPESGEPQRIVGFVEQGNLLPVPAQSGRLRSYRSQIFTSLRRSSARRRLYQSGRPDPRRSRSTHRGRAPRPSLAAHSGPPRRQPSSCWSPHHCFNCGVAADHRPVECLSQTSARTDTAASERESTTRHRNGWISDNRHVRSPLIVRCTLAGDTSPRPPTGSVSSALEGAACGWSPSAGSQPRRSSNRRLVSFSPAVRSRRRISALACREPSREGARMARMPGSGGQHVPLLTTTRPERTDDARADNLGELSVVCRRRRRASPTRR